MTDDKMFRELRKIAKVLILSNAKLIESEISKIATTDDRKKMWALIDGQRSSKDIANELKVTQRAVQYFLKEAKIADFIEYVENDAPRKTLEYVPPAWIELLVTEASEDSEKKPLGTKPEQLQQIEGEKSNA